MQNPESIPGENLNCYQVPDSAGLTEDVHSRKGKNFFKQVLGRVLDSCGGQKHGDATAYLCSRLE